MSGTRCESRLPGDRSPWSTCLVPKSLHTPKINKWECEIPTGNQQLRIGDGRLLVMAISTKSMRISNHPHDRTIMHDQIRPQNSRS